MSPTQNKPPIPPELQRAIDEARKNAEHAETRGNFDSAHHQVLANLLKSAGIEKE